MGEGFAPGIYFGMSNLVYHADPAIGSTSLRLLRRNARRWWRGSIFNPNAEERLRFRKETQALAVGSAMHMIVLEGREVFEKTYKRRPNDPPGASASDKGDVTRRFKKTLMTHEYMLFGPEFDWCVGTADLITGHPDLCQLFTVPSYREVAVFWTRVDGVRCKAKFDLVFPRGIVDLKSLENTQDLPVEMACALAFKRYRIDMQAEFYLEAFNRIPLLVSKDAIYSINLDGYPERSSASTLVVARDHLDFAHTLVIGGAVLDIKFQLIFIQKSFPAVWSCTLSPGNSRILHDISRPHIEEAIGIYRDNLARFGPDKPWEDVWRVHELHLEDIPGGEAPWGWN